jgi:hypothetical protein
MTFSSTTWTYTLPVVVMLAWRSGHERVVTGEVSSRGTSHNLKGNEKSWYLQPICDRLSAT